MHPVPASPDLCGHIREEGAAWAGQHRLALFQGSQQSVPSIRRCITAFRDAGADVVSVPIGRFVVVGETDKAALQVAGPAAERLTSGYRRGGDQLRRGTLTEEDTIPNGGCAR